MPDPRPEKKQFRPVVSLTLPTGEMLETVFDPAAPATGFIVFDGKKWRSERKVELPGGVTLVPYSAENNLITHRVVLFPSAPEEYGSEEELFADVRSFIHRYVDLSDGFEEVSTAYVLFSWVYDAFNEVPYLRVRGDYGSGKSRFLLTVGSLCYKPIFASGASTVSPIFRILDAVQGTLVVDEGDFRASDEKAEIIKILNNGNAKGFPVLRSEQTPAKEFNPRAFHVFGPKLVATRNLFDDRALESRCLSEEMGTRPLRPDISINLPEAFEEEARTLRNKLLLYRLRTRASRRPLAAAPPGLEPRLSQILLPLLSTAPSEETRARLLALAKRSGEVISTERAMAMEAEVLAILYELREEKVPLAVIEIAQRFAKRHAAEYEYAVTPRWIGSILRRKLMLNPQKRGGTFTIPASEYPKLARLFEKYSVGRQDIGDIGDVQPGEERDGTSAESQESSGSVSL
ncbi:MAG: hypothetical protein ABIS20_01265 [Thermoanaerobaculia bacterium]